MTPESTKAQAWAARHSLHYKEIAARTGYADITVYWFLRGETPPLRNGSRKPSDRRIRSWVWQRFKRACGDVDAELNGRKPGASFDW